MNVIKAVSDKVLVLKNGKVVEYDESNIIFNETKTNYTKTLINAIPKGFD